jgi:cytochrome c2
MGLLDIGKKLVDPLGLVFDDKKTAKLPQATDIFKVNKKTGLNLAGTQVKGVEGYYNQAIPSTMRTMDKYGGAFMDQGFKFGQQGVTGFQGLRDLAAGGEANAMARLREAELGTMTDQAGMTRGLMESLSPEQAAQVKNMQDLASQAAGAEGAYAGRMGEALGTYGIRPQEFGSTVTSSNLSPTATQRGVLGSTVTQGGLLNPTIQAAEQDAAMANQMAQEAYARRGTLSSQEQRSAQQTAREAAQSAGRLGGNAAIAAEIQNREAALAGRRAQASQAGQQAFDQRQNLANLRFQEQQGLFNQQGTARQIRTAEEQALFNQQLGARDQVLQQEQALFNQRAAGAGQTLAEQQALFNQGITGATTTADMQQAGLNQLQDIEKMRAGLRSEAGSAATNAYNAAGGFYTTPGLNLFKETPASYTAGTNMAHIGLKLGETMTPSLDPNLGLNLALTKSGQMDARSLAQYQMDMQAKIARDKMIGDMIGTGASIFMASDRRLKTDIQRVGTTDGGVPIYTYKYKGESMTQMGVMAQDVEKVNPEAVREFGGYKAVNYALVK